ncbi:MAG: hypothetical protein SH809_20500 [Rhodothermales bacterium]|nr:hypothetical protein [Rhodothermales bacterium]
MHPLLSRLHAADYAFLVGLIESPFNATDDQALRLRRDRFADDPSDANREALTLELENAIRYLGSSDAAFLFRRLQGRDPGVPFQEIVRDVAAALKVSLPTMVTDGEMLAHVVETYVTREFSKLSAEEQQALLVSLGVEQERAAAFVKKSAGVFALPLLIQAFGSLVVDGLIKRVIFGAIGAIIGKQLAMRLFDFIAKRFPWWVSWIGPAAWTLSLGWTALDITGPALRKTIPIVLYLGLCQLRGDTSPTRG